MGDKADKILRSLNLTVDKKRFYETVKTKLEGHFGKCRNLIFERAKFSKRGAKVLILLLPHYIASQNIATMVPLETR